jgi:manganese oxidase
MHTKLITITGSTLLLMHSLSHAATDLPPSAKVEMGTQEEVCSDFTDANWRKEQEIDGVKIQASHLCNLIIQPILLPLSKAPTAFRWKP